MTLFVSSVVLILHVISSSFAANVRLVGVGNNPDEGRVEVFYKGEWGTVCDDLWNELTASIVCRALNKGFGEVLPIGTYPPGTGKIWMDDVNCVGLESNLFECTSRPYGQNDCKHSEDVAIRCLNKAKPTSTVSAQPTNCQGSTSEIRLKGKIKGIGTVEVNNQGTWGTICDDFWNLQDARVVCRQLCYNETYALPGATRQYIDDNKTPVRVNRLNCVGTEGKIKQCPDFTWSSSTCKLMEAASVTCIYQDNAAKKAPSAKLICTDSSMTALFNRTTDPVLETKHLKVGRNYNGSCSPVLNQNTTFVSITIPVSECGMTVQKNNSHIIYTLLLWYLPTKISGDVIKQNTWRHILSCSFPRQGRVSQKPWIPLTVVVTQKSVGTFVFEMAFYQQSTFKEKITKFPVLLLHGAWLNVAVSLKTEQNNLKLIVPSCWVTVSANRNAQPKHVLFSNKCPVDEEVSLMPLNQTTLGFRFQTFAFLNNSGPLYVHCDTFVCLQSEKTEQCDQTCGFKSRRRKRSDAARILNMIYHVTSKPFLVNVLKTTKTDKTDSSQKQWTTSTIERQTTSRDIVLLRKKHDDQMIVSTTESGQRQFLTDQINPANNDATEINTKTTQMTPSFLTRSTIKEEINTEMVMLSNNSIVTRNVRSILTPKTTTSNLNKHERAEFAMLAKTMIPDTSKAVGLKYLLHFQRQYLVIILIWCLT